ncbi:MAG: PulJ/GspJ family protein [Acidimicrobiales bacterium]
MSRAEREQGFTLVEITVAMVVFMIVLSMTYGIATVLVKQSILGTGNGAAAEAAQSQVSGLEQYLRGTISPADAIAASTKVVPGVATTTVGGVTITLTVWASTSWLLANGTSESVISTLATDGSSSATGDVISLSMSGPACGTLSSSSGTQGSGGGPQFTYTSSTTAGSCTLTATESQHSLQATQVITQTPSSPCSAASGAVVSAQDYALEICAVPPPSPNSQAASCTSSNFAGPATTCPQLYQISIDPTSCSPLDQCTLEVQNLTVTKNPTVFTFTDFRCNSACLYDIQHTTGHEGNGASPSFPYLFTYYDSNGAQIDGSTPSAVRSVQLDLEALTLPANPGRPQWTEIRDTVWLAGAAQSKTS